MVSLENDTPPCSALALGGYLRRCPRDPAWPNRGYRYRSLNGATYELTAVLDDASLPYCLLAGSDCLFSLSDAGIRIGTFEQSRVVPLEGGYLPKLEEASQPVEEDV